MRLVYITGILMLSYFSTFAQSSFGLNGMLGISGESFTSMNSFEYNPSNYSVIKDWGFSFTYGGEFAEKLSSNLYQITTAKKFKSHFFSLRYTPGYQKEFVFRSATSTGDSTNEQINLESKYLYKELFGFGYSYKINKDVSVGFNGRYFKQDFTEEIITAIFSDTLYLVKESDVDNSDFWKFDLGLIWQPHDKLIFNFATRNLLIFKNNLENQSNNKFEIKTNKSIIIGINYNPTNNLIFNLNYESENSFLTGFTYLIPINNNKIGFAFSAFPDAHQKPFIAGINPAVIFISKYFDLSLTYIKYFSDRTTISSYSDFTENGISNILHNKYSYDKLLLTTNFKLNTIAEQRAKILDIEIENNIYPALSDKYMDTPIAKAKVLNLTNEFIEVKPLMSMNGISSNKFQSPIVSIAPNDTGDINYYLSIPEDYSKVNPEIVYADFYINTVNDDFDDEYQKPILVNSINAWDGNVHNLKYFVFRDMDFSIKYAKAILAKHKPEIDTLTDATSDFYKAKIIFNAFIEKLTYTSDPRASVEYVQYPKQTLELKGGDCDDLSVCYGSLLESIGIETALVDYKNSSTVKHVNVMFNTKLLPQQAFLITGNDTKYFIRKNELGIAEVWIPIETTSLSDFESAWILGSEKFQTEAINEFGLLKGMIEIIDVN
ncbi:MAG: hypothetical protein ABI638_10490 [Ignavibacteriota bacterium]